MTQIFKMHMAMGLFFALAMLGCQRKETLPAPKDKVPTATIDKIKAWYEPKIARLRGAKTTGLDIYLPQWGDGKLHTLPTGERIALFPVHREADVRYYDIGFVRRFAVRLDDQDNVKSVKLLEAVGKKEYLRDHKDEVALRFYQGNTQDMPIFAWQQDIELQMEKIDPICTTTGISVDDCWMTTFSRCGGMDRISKTYVCSSSSGGIGGSGIIYDIPEDGNGGSGGGSGTGTPSKTDIGDNTNIILPIIEPLRNITLDDAFKNHPKAMCIYDRIKKMIEAGDANANNNLFWRLSAPFSGANSLQLNIKLVEESQMKYSGANGEVDPDGIPNGVITIKINRPMLEITSDINGANTILHELIHAYFYALIEKMGGESALLAYVGTQEPYKSLKYFYQKYADREAQHNAMASKTYRDFMIKAMKAFMGADQLSNWRYEGLSWAGLDRTEAWDNLDAAKRRTSVAALYETLKKNASNKNKCD